MSEDEDGVRESLVRALMESHGVKVKARGWGLDVVETVGWAEGNCSDPVVIHMPHKWVARFVAVESTGYLATLIAEALESDSETEVTEIIVGGDLFRRPVVKVRRR